MKVSRYRLVTTDAAHRPGITIMSRRENGCTVYRAFNTGELSRVFVNGICVEAGSYADCVAQLFPGGI